MFASAMLTPGNYRGAPKSPAMRRVVILGGGFGGIYAALRLQSHLRKRSDIEVTLVNRENFFLLTSMLPQVAASSVDTRHIVAPIRRVCPRIQFFEADVEHVDFARKTVRIAHGLCAAASTTIISCWPWAASPIFSIFRAWKSMRSRSNRYQMECAYATMR